MPDAHKNFAYSTVATAPSPDTTGTSLVVETGDGAKFPTPPFNATVWPVGDQPLTTNAEIVRVTAISGDTFTITRAQEGTVARAIVVGDQIAATITAKTLTDAEQIIPNLTAITVSGAFTVPASVTALLVEAWGGGGGGAGGSGNGSGGGGGGGAFCQSVIAVTPGETLDAVIGAGGTAGGVNGNGGAGGTTTFKRGATTLLEARGGAGGVSQGNGGAGGVAAVGSFLVNGAQGTAGAAGIESLGGAGGASPFGVGGQGSGWATPPPAAARPGGGGGGGSSSANGVAGGPGGPGLIRITYWKGP